MGAGQGLTGDESRVSSQKNSGEKHAVYLGGQTDLSLNQDTFKGERGCYL